jgi:hypothetical protein
MTEKQKKRKPGNPRTETRYIGNTATLERHHWQKAELIGDGNSSKGIRRALDKYEQDK